MRSVCTNTSCGLIFQAPSLIGGTNATVILKEIYTDCPRCGEMAKYDDGVYRFDENGVRSFLRMIHPMDLVQIQKAAEQVLTNNGTIKDFKQAISKVNPAYVSFFDEIGTLSKDENFRYWIKLFLKLLVALLGGAAITDSNINIDININSPVSISQPPPSFSKNYERSLRERNLNKMNKARDTVANAPRTNKSTHKGK